MLRSVRSQIVAATSAIILVILGATAYFVIDQKIKEINQDIYTQAVSFAELTHERIIRNYEANYTQQAFAHFDREMAEIYSLNSDITGVGIYNYKGEKLYDGIDSRLRGNDIGERGNDIGERGNDIGEREDDKGGARDDSLDHDPQALERIQATWPSIKTKEGRVVYLEKTEQGLRMTNPNGREVDPINSREQITDVIYPFRDQNNVARSFSIRYGVSYEALGARVRETATNIVILAAMGLVIALMIGGLVAARITSPIRILSEGALKIGKGDLKTRIQVRSENEIGKLADTFNKMAKDLEKSTQELVQKEKLTHELELAGQIQQELLPKTLPKLKNLELFASLQSATEVGGDCYDFLPTPKGLMFYVADVTGHGVAAGLVSAISNALVPAFMEQHHDTRELVIHLNTILKLKTRANMFMTMVMALWNESKSELNFTQAGHDPILHYDAKAKEVRALATGGMALGMIPNIAKLVKTETVPVAKDDVLVLYTDGIPEAWKNEKENLGMDRFKESIARHAHLKNAQTIHDALLKDVHEFMGKYPQQDDITLIVAKRIG